MGVRFAPSPTGRFHVGNLRTAWISHRIARALGLPWVVRFEDIDGPRVLPGAQEEQLADMAELGLKPDEVVVQSERFARHAELFEKAAHAGVIYPCVCSRKEVSEALQRMASAPHSRPPLYAGTCRHGAVSKTHPTIAWRFLDESDPSGGQDFIVGRTDTFGNGGDAGRFTPAYNWACAIDDFDGGYRLLVRAWDLAHVASQQRLIQCWLSRVSGMALDQKIFHCSLVTQDAGERLEKRTRGVTLAELRDAGFSPERIVAIFEKSFGFSGDFLGNDAGEPKQVLKLSELGFP